jgi:hypothetical protein
MQLKTLFHVCFILMSDLEQQTCRKLSKVFARNYKKYIFSGFSLEGLVRPAVTTSGVSTSAHSTRNIVKQAAELICGWHRQTIKK